MLGPVREPAPLVGREREQRLLHDHLSATLAGQGGLVLIGGEAGIGKTALAESLCREAAERGALVLTGRCYDLTETPPYGPWVELFAGYRRRDALPPLPAAFARRGGIGAVSSQASLFDQALDFLTALADQQPVMLLPDDLHWADVASLDLLRFLGRSLSTMPLLLLATYRADELTRRHPLYQLLPVLVREAAATRIDLRPLTEGDVTTLVTQRYRLTEADTHRLTIYLHTRSEGNPFFTGELLRTLEEEGELRADTNADALGDLTRVRVPPLLRQVIDGRLTRLSDDAQRLLAVAAVIGQTVSLPLWASVGAVDENTVSAIVEEAARARLLEESPDGAQAQFVHALIREALYEGIMPSQRRRLHQQVGEALAALVDPDPDAVAYHFGQAGDARTAQWLVTAMSRAEAAHALLTAADRAEAALALLERDAHAVERGWLLLFLARLHRYADPRRGVTYLTEAATLAEQTGDAALTAYVAVRRGLARCMAGEYRHGLAELEAGVTAMRDIRPEERPWLRGWPRGWSSDHTVPNETVWEVHPIDGRGTLVQQLVVAGYIGAARTLGERLVAEFDAATAGGVTRAQITPAVADGFIGLAKAYQWLCLPDDAMRVFTRAETFYRALNNYTMVYQCLTSVVLYVLTPFRTEQVAERERLMAEAEAVVAHASGARPALPDALARLPVLIFEPHWPALRDLIDSVPLDTLGSYRSNLGPIARWQGEREIAMALVRDILPSGSGTEPGDSRFTTATDAQRLAAALAIDVGDLDTTRLWLEAHDRWLAWSGSIHGRADGQLGWAAYYRAAGDAALAYEHATRAYDHATAPRQPLALLAAHRLLGELDTEAGRVDNAIAHLDAALALADACAAPYERALTLLALADLRTATGDPGAATQLLDEVRTICVPLRAAPALARADALAARLAVSSDRPAYPAGLSAREVEVLRLLAAGKTNREIAETLFLSVATVNNHVAHILTKTETDNRAAAAVYAQRHNLT
ncbi:MAG: helix-turn-helix transcriptional regulator [Thermomicrobiales bacterium]